MAVTLQVESTEYVYVGVTGDVPTGGPPAAEIAFLAAGVRPTTQWSTALIVNATTNSELLPDADASDAIGDYYVARLVGSFGTGGVELTAGDYVPWIRLTDTVEQPVLIAPVTVTIAGP